MKSVKSAADLKKLALRQGAVVDMGGKKFNAGGVKANVVRMPKPEPKPEPKVEVAPPPPAPVSPTISIDMQPVAQEMAIANSRMEQLIERMLAAQLADKPRSAYRATVKRDDEGRIQFIDLIPKE